MCNDKTLTIYEPAGVLLLGTGACRSHTSAYSLLLDEFGIENIPATSIDMNHT